MKRIFSFFNRIYHAYFCKCDKEANAYFLAKRAEDYFKDKNE